MVSENLKEKTRTEVSREYNINQQLIANWKKQFLKKSPQLFSLSAKKQNNDKQKKIEKLEKVIDRQTIEIQFLKKILEHLE